MRLSDFLFQYNNGYNPIGCCRPCLNCWTRFYNRPLCQKCSPRFSMTAQPSSILCCVIAEQMFKISLQSSWPSHPVQLMEVVPVKKTCRVQRIPTGACENVLICSRSQKTRLLSIFFFPSNILCKMIFLESHSLHFHMCIGIAEPFPANISNKVWRTMIYDAEGQIACRIPSVLLRWFLQLSLGGKRRPLLPMMHKNASHFSNCDLCLPVYRILYLCH